DWEKYVDGVRLTEANLQMIYDTKHSSDARVDSVGSPEATASAAQAHPQPSMPDNGWSPEATPSRATPSASPAASPVATSSASRPKRQVNLFGQFVDP
ncbi:unnamed protein product, partial [Prorocentrum cordatum]